MKSIKKFDNAIANKSVNFEEEKINVTMLCAYKDSRERGYDRLNFDEVIWADDIEPIVGCCKAEGIDEITISSSQCSIAEVLWKLKELGCELTGITRVKRLYYHAYGKIDKVAFIVKIA